MGIDVSVLGLGRRLERKRLDADHLYAGVKLFVHFKPEGLCSRVIATVLSGQKQNHLLSSGKIFLGVDLYLGLRDRTPVHSVLLCYACARVSFERCFERIRPLLSIGSVLRVKAAVECGERESKVQYDSGRPLHKLPHSF